jgi:SWIM zinc finger
LNQLKGVGVDEAAILAKVGKEKTADLNLDDLVMLAADYKAIENGDAHASELFELKEAKPTGAATDLKSKLKAQVEAAPKAEISVSVHTAQISVRPAKMPFTYYVTDATGEYLTGVDGDKKSCNCSSQSKGPCAHIEAVERYLKS